MINYTNLIGRCSRILFSDLGGGELLTYSMVEIVLSAFLNIPIIGVATVTIRLGICWKNRSTLSGRVVSKVSWAFPNNLD